jgi:hypothetical protein
MPSQRSKRWEIKTRTELLAPVLDASHDLNARLIKEAYDEIDNVYSFVAKILDQNGVLANFRIIYRAYAEELWKLKKTYNSNALQTKVDALYLYYLASGLDNFLLRLIAQALGLNVSTIEDIVEKTLSPIILKIIGQGTITTNGTEQVVIEYTGSISSISGYIDLSNMVDGDSVTINAYVKIKETGDYVLYRPETYSNKQTEPALYVMPRLSGYAFKVTIQQTQGSYKNFDYLFVKGV